MCYFTGFKSCRSQVRRRVLSISLCDAIDYRMIQLGRSYSKELNGTEAQGLIPPWCNRLCCTGIKDFVAPVPKQLLRFGTNSVFGGKAHFWFIQVGERTLTLLSRWKRLHGDNAVGSILIQTELNRLIDH